jgi:hypothetical protein
LGENRLDGASEPITGVVGGHNDRRSHEAYVRPALLDEAKRLLPTWEAAISRGTAGYFQPQKDANERK